jgi:hypothetical protein
VPGLKVTLGDGAAQRRPRDPAKSGCLACGQNLFLRRSHALPPES